MDVKISDHCPRRLQVGHVDIQVHSIDRFELQHDVVTQYIRHRSCYAHCGLRSSRGLATHRASSSHDQASSLPARPESTLYPFAVISPLAIHLGGLRRSLPSLHYPPEGAYRLVEG